MTFRENINRICKERGTTLSAVTRSMGLSSSKVTAWNNGSLPKEEVLLGLAKELECSVMDFFADEEDLAQETEVATTNDTEQTLINEYRKLSKSQQYKLMAYCYALLEGNE